MQYCQTYYIIVVLCHCGWTQGFPKKDDGIIQSQWGARLFSGIQAVWVSHDGHLGLQEHSSCYFQTQMNSLPPARGVRGEEDHAGVMNCPTGTLL